MRIHILGLQYYKKCSKFSNIESKYCPQKILRSRPLGQAARLDYQMLNESYSNIIESRDCENSLIMGFESNSCPKTLYHDLHEILPLSSSGF